MDAIKFVLLCTVFCHFSMGTSENVLSDGDIDTLISALEADPSISLESLGDLDTFNHESELKSIGGSFAIAKPSVDIFKGAGKFFTIPVEILRLAEAFLKVKGELLNHFLVLFNDNWEVIRAVCNLIVSKAPKLVHSLSLGVSVLRRILEFAVHAFTEWSVSLPSVSVSGFKNKFVNTHAAYGVPSAVGVASIPYPYSS